MKNNQKAFTLIELLVVISIIALLLSILMPSLGRIKEQARTLVCRSNVKQIALAHELYSTDHNNRVMDHYGGPDIWCTLIAPYMSEDRYKQNPRENLEGAMRTLYCPATKDPVVPYDPDDPSTYGIWGAAKNRWRYHYQDPSGLHYGAEASYALNYWVGGWNLDALVAYGTITPEEKTLSFRDGAIGRADVPVYADAVWLGGMPKDNQAPPDSTYELIDPPMWYPGMTRFCVDRHNMATNVSFTDGHAQLVKLEDLWKLKWNKTFLLQDVRMPVD